MHEIETRKANRYKLLKSLYDVTGANTRRWADLRVICSHYRLNRADFTAAHQYLTDAGLIKPYGAGYTSYITHKGIVAIEQAAANPLQPTAYFPSVADIESYYCGDIEKL